MLGNRFPESLRRGHIQATVKPGVVIFLFCPFTDPPKDKYLVLCSPCDDSEVLVLTINSRIAKFIENRADLRSCQVKINASDYHFLHHDSYIDCSKVITDFDSINIERQLLSDLTRIKGELSETTKQEIVAAVQMAKTISPHHKRIITTSLAT